MDEMGRFSVDSSHTKRRKAILLVVLVVGVMALACGACPLATNLQPPEVQEIEKVVTRIVEVIPTDARCMTHGPHDGGPFVQRGCRQISWSGRSPSPRRRR